MKEGLSREVERATKVDRWVSFKDDLSADLPLSELEIDSYYISLLGELFDALDDIQEDYEWYRLGLAFFQFNRSLGQATGGISKSRVALFSATAFYVGGFSASAYLAIRSQDLSESSGAVLDCFELLSRPNRISSNRLRGLVDEMLSDQTKAAEEVLEEYRIAERKSLDDGPENWVPSHLLVRLVDRFQKTNVRTVLRTQSEINWNRLIESFRSRKPPVWDFFPSQITAIENGLLSSDSSMSMQLPTGAGKTALMETLAFYNSVQKRGTITIILVPFRALASELRRSIVKNLNDMGVSARSIYGGSVPTAGEIRNLDMIDVIVATPESMIAVLTSVGNRIREISLVICDEGHLLDDPQRGVGLELLLARMRASSPRFIFSSAIVPNIEEINSWLGGEFAAIRSEFRPTQLRYASLSDQKVKDRKKRVELEFYDEKRQLIEDVESHFLDDSRFSYINPSTGRMNVYKYESIKTRSVAAARKSLTRGSVVIFSANKSGSQGVSGLAEELLKQLEFELSLPTPISMVEKIEDLKEANRLFEIEFGTEWVGTQLLAVGAAMHHGDIPQEFREIIETLFADSILPLVICTTTLAEGVNLPINTLVLHKLSRYVNDKTVKMSVRDVKNLIGRSGRSGVSTEGWVICANQKDWDLVISAAGSDGMETVQGALRSLISRINSEIYRNGLQIGQMTFVENEEYRQLIDGIDSILIELWSEQEGLDGLQSVVQTVIDNTFAAFSGQDDIISTLNTIFRMRESSIRELGHRGNIALVRSSGIKFRFLDPIDVTLREYFGSWESLNQFNQDEILQIIVQWAWGLPDMLSAMDSISYRVVVSERDFLAVIQCWISGKSYLEIASSVGMDLDDLLLLMSRAVCFSFQECLEQAISYISVSSVIESVDLPSAIEDLPLFVRFGVNNNYAVKMMSAGVRHRRIVNSVGGRLQEVVVLHNIPDISVFSQILLIERVSIIKKFLGASWFRMYWMTSSLYPMSDLNISRLQAAGLKYSECRFFGLVVV